MRGTWGGKDTPHISGAAYAEAESPHRSHHPLGSAILRQLCPVAWQGQAGLESSGPGTFLPGDNTSIITAFFMAAGTH